MCTRRCVLLATLLGVALMAIGCTSLLPRSRSESSAFERFEDAQLAVERLVPMKSSRGTLTEAGLNAEKLPNTVILTQSDVLRRFLPSNVLRMQDLDPGVIACIEAKDKCRGLEFNLARISRIRTGGFFSDFINFSRRTETTGWRFNGIVLLVNDLVVYRAWGGQPLVNEVDVTNNPLGPLQDIGPSVVISR